MADNNTILDYGEIENLDEAKLQEAKKKFQDNVKKENNESLTPRKEAPGIQYSPKIAKVGFVKVFKTSQASIFSFTWS